MKHRKRRTLSVAALTAICTLGIAGASLADGPGKGPMPNVPQMTGMMQEKAHFGGGRGWHRGKGGGHHPLSARPLISIALRHQEELKLTDRQVKRLEDIRDAFSKKAVKQRAEMSASRVDLRRVLDAEKVNMADAERRIREISKIRVDLRIARLKAIQEGKSVLNDEQKKQLTQIARKHGEDHHGGWWRRMFRQGDSESRPQTY